METKFIIAGIGFLAIGLLYALSKNKTKTNFDKEYDELLNSSKYKVKGQYD